MYYHPPKAVGVGEWEKEFEEQAHAYQEAFYIGGNHSTMTDGEAYWKAIEFSKSFFKALTSATRAAEERKDEEIMSAIRFIEFSLFKWDEKSMPLNREVVGNVLTLLQNKLHALLPPPPSNQ